MKPINNRRGGACPALGRGKRRPYMALGILLVALFLAVPAQADKSLDQLPPLSAPAGSDSYYCVQNYADYRCTLDQIRAWNAVAVSGGVIDGAAIGASNPSTVKGSTLETTGNAGIGTAPGTHRLEVRLDGAGFQTIAAFENQQAAAANVGPQIMFEGASNTDMASVQSGWNGTATTDAYLTWSTRSSNAMGERMRLTSAGKLGIGATPVNQLDVEGGAAIGATYAGSSTAPTNGLIVEGNVGIGAAGGVNMPLLVMGTGASLINTITIQNQTAAASGVGSYINFAGPSGVTKATIVSQYDDASGNEASMMFQNRAGGATAERMRIKGANVGIGTNGPTEMLDINSNNIRIRTAKTPAAQTEACDQGEVSWDASYIYVCTATNYWERTAIAPW